MEESDRPVLISVLQHYAYCPRQFALIHIEQVWAENYFTVHGNLLHERVDSCEPDTFRRDHSSAYIDDLFTEITGSDSNEN